MYAHIDCHCRRVPHLKRHYLCDSEQSLCCLTVQLLTTAADRVRTLQQVIHFSQGRLPMQLNIRWALK